MISISVSNLEEKSIVKVDYYMAFNNIADCLVMEVVLYEKIRNTSATVYKIDIQPTKGNAFTFSGNLYYTEQLTSPLHLRLYFVSQYYKNLVSAIPLFGKGVVTDIIKSLYGKASVPTVDISRKAENSLDNVLFPRTTRMTDAIQYLLNRIQVGEGYFLSTVIQDVAYIRNIMDGKKQLTNFYYTISDIRDNRKRVDVLGGIKAGVLSDSIDARQKNLPKFKGSDEVDSKVFYDVPDYALDMARARVSQSKVYYTNYQATIGFVGWVPFIGQAMVVDDTDMYAKARIPGQGLIRGQYFCSAQVLSANVSENLEQSQCLLQLVKEAA